MRLTAQALRYVARRYLSGPSRAHQSTARTNAAEASADLQVRRRERADVEAYLEAHRRTRRSPAET